MRILICLVSMQFTFFLFKAEFVAVFVFQTAVHIRHGLIALRVSVSRSSYSAGCPAPSLQVGPSDSLLNMTDKRE